jgi:polysaccharide biosynthesis/export protein
MSHHSACQIAALIMMADAMAISHGQAAFGQDTMTQEHDLARSALPASVDGPRAPVAMAQPNQRDVLIGAGDLIEVSVYGTKDFDKQVRVSESGEVSLPLTGPVKVAGFTTLEVEQLIAKLLADGKYFNNPQVSVFAKEYSTQGVSVLGEVQKPGIYPLLGDHSLFDAISAAGGTTQKAGKEVTITHQLHRAQPQTVTLSYGPDGHADGSTPVYPGDTVVVSKAGIVYVVGDVRLPSGIVMENSKLTVLQAIAMAQGTNPTASLDKTRLIRSTLAGRQEIPIALKSVLASKAPDPEVQPDDIIFVPSSAAKSATRRGLEAAIEAATGVVIYRR